MLHRGTGRALPRRALAGAGALSLALSLSGCLPVPAAVLRPADEGSSTLWVNPESPAARQAQEWQNQGRAADAALLRRIAREPVAEWIGSDDPGGRARALTESAARAHRLPVLVAYHIPYRDCGRHSAGGAPGPEAYRGWIRALAAGIGGRPALVVVEPDAVAQVVDGCVPPAGREERLALLDDAVAVLAALPAARVYLDGGNPGWIKEDGRMADALRRAGVARADGFALNVSNFETTGSAEEYGHRLSHRLGGAHFVIDTSRNGRGPHASGHGEDGWCNPPGRELGPSPTTRTGRPRVDALLWIKRPGESDGTCNGGPPAGQWWPDYALGLARASVG